MKKYSQLSLIVKIFKQTFNVAPLSAIIIFLQYVVRGLFPLLLFVFTSRLTAEAVLLLDDDKGSIQTLAFFAVLLVVSFIIMQLLNGVESISLDVGIYEKCRRYRKQLIMNASFRYPLICFEKSDFLDFQERTEDAVERGVLSHIFTRTLLIVSNIISVVSLSVTLAIYSPWYLLAALISVVPFFISRLIRGKAFYAAKKIKATQSRYRDYLFGLFSDKRSVKELRIYDCSDFIFKKYAGARDDVNNELLRQTKIESRSVFICEIIKVMGYALSIIISLLLSFNSGLPIAIFAASITAFTSVQNSTKGLFRGVGELCEYNKYAQDFFNYIEYQSDFSQNDTAEEFDLHSIECSNLSFTYPDRSTPVLFNVDLKIKKGESIAIVGENGSGKTTLIKLLMGLYQPDTGIITVDGIPIKNDWFLNSASIIQQNFMQYALSLKENIAISDVSRIDDNNNIIKCLTDVGFETNISIEEILSPEFGGADLSKGQWQKVSIARGLFRDRDFLFVDEPTAALDPLSEYDLLKKLISFKKGKTLILVSHRCGICKFTDRILVMKQGQIVESGTHQELLALDGEYKRLFIEQAKWYV